MDLALIASAFAVGGFLKGATGAGAPIIAVPVLALIYNVQTAVVLFVMPNVISNAIQAIQYRKEQVDRRFTLIFAFGGLIGAGVGTILLASFSGASLMRLVAAAVFLYVAFRLLRPDWKLDFGTAKRFAAPAGFLAGILQGAAGISAPVSITFLNAIKLERKHFIAIISVFFLAMGLLQLPLLIWFKLMTWQRFIESCFALIPLTLFMPLGSIVGTRVSANVFDKAILFLLTVVAIRLVWLA